jgi:phosphohistidine phosphatase
VTRALAAADELPTLLLTSSLVRAVQTAEIVASLAGAPLEFRRELVPEGDGRGLIARLLSEAGSAPTGGERIMVVGHEPDLGELAAYLSGHPFGVGLDKAMVVGLATRSDEPLTWANVGE